MFLQLETFSEAKPGEKWQRRFERFWPSYKTWFLRDGDEARTDLVGSRATLSHYMPELVDTYDQLCELAGGSDLTSRFLSMVDPPRYLAGCSQLVWTQGEPTLFRNYDFSPRLFEGVIVRTEWLRPVIGVSECTWGLLDGMNADGLSACLSFGGRQTVGKGFGIPLIVRYLLETCTTVPEACARVVSLPVHMAFSITMVDADSRVATVHLSPDRPPVVTADATCTNHQIDAERIEQTLFNRSLERKSYLDTLLDDPLQDRATLIRHFLGNPLRSDQYDGTFGTLYTAAYQPLRKEVEFFWPSHQIKIGFDDFFERIFHVDLLPSADPTLTA